MSVKQSIAFVITFPIACIVLYFAGAVLLPAATRSTTTDMIPPKFVKSDDPVDLIPGIPINFMDHGRPYTCSIGFFVTDDLGNNYAITAGHCAREDGMTVTVYGHEIGHMYSTHGPLDYATIALNPAIAIKPWHTNTGSPTRGDDLCKWGATTGHTCGKVNSRLGPLIIADTLMKAGDSGGPAESPDRSTVYGITSANMFLPRSYAPSIFFSATDIMDSIHSGDAPGIIGGDVHLASETVVTKRKVIAVGN